MALEDLTPSNRFELALSGDMTAEEASNRIEQILAGADIEPADRLEYFLKLRVSGGGGGGDTPLNALHYVGSFDMLNPTAAYDYEVPAVVDTDNIGVVFCLPRELQDQPDGNYIPSIIWSNMYTGVTPNPRRNKGLLDPESDFRYDAAEQMFILHVDSYRTVCVGTTDIFYVVKQED